MGRICQRRETEDHRVSGSQQAVPQPRACRRRSNLPVTAVLGPEAGPMEQDTGTVAGCGGISAHNLAVVGPRHDVDRQKLQMSSAESEAAAALTQCLDLLA